MFKSSAHVAAYYFYHYPSGSRGAPSGHYNGARECQAIQALAPGVSFYIHTTFILEGWQRSLTQITTTGRVANPVPNSLNTVAH